LKKSQQYLADRALKLAEQEMARRQREGYSTLRDVPLRKYEYNMPVEENVTAPAMIPAGTD
jgi:hypothetical protein